MAHSINGRAGLTALILGAALSAVVLSPAWAVQPRAEVEVAGEIVTVGDLFADAGDVAGEAVFYAPAPGRSVEIGPNFLHRVALGFDLDWQPGSGMSRVIVRRAANRIGTDEMAPILLAAIGAQVGGSFDPSRTQLSFDGGIAPHHLPVGLDPTLATRDLSYDPRSQRFTAIIEIAAGTQHAASLRASGRLRSVMTVPVLVRAVARGDLIGPQDVDWMEIDAERLSSSILLDADALVGLTARRALSPSRPIAESDVQAPIAIERGEIVTMVLESGPISLTARGRALENGTKGQVIRVVNTQSSRTVEATVTGPGVVRVSAPNDALNG